MKKIEEIIKQIIEEENNRSIPEFEDYSPNEMEYILNSPFEENSPIELLKLPDSDYENIPILKQIKYLLRIVEKHGELKLTTKGYLPTKIVADIYKQGFIKDEWIDSGIMKLYKELDSVVIGLTRILAELSGVVKKRRGRLSLTKKGRMQLDDNYELFKNLFTTFALKFNWAYFDYFESEEIGQLGFGFTLILLKKYGNKKRPDSFYAKKYFEAFPHLLEDVRPTEYLSVIEKATTCYSVRTFKRFLDYFGLIKTEGQGFFSKIYLKKTKFFDKIIKIKPPARLFE